MDIEYYEEDGSLHFKFSNFRRRRNNDVGLHQPNIIDGGWIIKGNYNIFDGKYHVGYYEDSFACSEIQDEIAFEVEPKKEYIVYFDAKHRLRLKGGQFTRTYRKPTPEEIKARLEKEEEERKKRHEEYRKKYNIPPDVLLPDNFLPLIRLTNPQLIRNKIFTEFPKETNSKDSICYVHDLDNYTVGEHDCISMTFDETMNGGFGVQPESKENETELMLAKAFKSFCKKIFKKGK